jgi:DNA-binding NarL/FixJ family response regulator
VTSTRPLQPAAVRQLLLDTADRYDLPLTVAQTELLAAGIADALGPAPEAPLLSPRLLETLRYCANGLTVGEIAERTGRSVSGISSRINLILRKLGARDQAQAVAVALVLGLLTAADVELPSGAAADLEAS